MNWSSENLMRGRVLRDWDVDLTDTRVTRADLGTVSARSARGIVVNPELIESAREVSCVVGQGEFQLAAAHLNWQHAPREVSRPTLRRSLDDNRPPCVGPEPLLRFP